MKCYCCEATIVGICYCVGDSEFWLCPNCWSEVKRSIDIIKKDFYQQLEEEDVKTDG